MDDAAAASRIDRAALAQIPPALQSVIDDGDVSGFVTLIWRAGEELQLNTLGQRDIAAGKPMTRDTLFRIASMTKPVVSTAALMLLEEGRLALQDPITRWAPEFADMRVLTAPDGPLEATYPAPRDITVEDLLTHRAGLAYDFTATGPVARAYQQALGPSLRSPHTPDEWMRRLGELPLLYPPGDRLHYSHATDVLGVILSRIEGRSLGEVLEQRIFRPLGMADTGFWARPEKEDRLARLYRASPDGSSLTDVSFPPEPEPRAFESGGGGLISSLDDYLTFARMLLGQGEVDGVRLLKPETVALMTGDRLTGPQRKHPFMGLPYWEGQGFGFGLSVITDPEKHAWLGTGSKGAFGWPGAFGTWWQADPAKQLILILLVQNSVALEPGAVSQLATGQRLGARGVLPIFQKLAHAAVSG